MNTKVFLIGAIALWCILGVANGNPQDGEPAAPAAAPGAAPGSAPGAGVGGLKKCEEENGHYNHESDCNKYYQCHDHVRYDFQCQAGLNFDLANTRCEFPDKAPCSH